MKYLIPPVLVVLASGVSLPADAQTLLTETFEGAVASNSPYAPGQIPGTGIEVLNGNAWIALDATQGHVLDLGSGWYAPNWDPQANVGSSTARSVASFDLQAGTRYTLSFDYSRQHFSAGNGPFISHLTVAVGAHEVTYDEVVGFYYGPEWKPGVLSFTPATSEQGVRVTLTAWGPGGYSGMDIDNIAWVGVPAAPVPEPAPVLLWLAGLGAAAGRLRQGAGWQARRRVSAPG